MKQNPAAWFVKLLERDFPLRKPRSTALAKRAGMVLQVIGACIVGVVLVAFAIAVIDGKIENFFFLAAVMIAGVLATAVAIFLLLFVGNAIGNLRRGVKAGFGRVEARRTIELDCDPDEAGQHARAALRQLPQGCELRPEEAAPGEILAKTSLSMNSAGEIITIGLAVREDGGTRVEIHSCPWFDTTMVDGGINAENVETIARHLQTAPARSDSASKMPDARRCKRDAGARPMASARRLCPVRVFFLRRRVRNGGGRGVEPADGSAACKPSPHAPSGRGIQVWRASGKIGNTLDRTDGQGISCSVPGLPRLWWRRPPGRGSRLGVIHQPHGQTHGQIDRQTRGRDSWRGAPAGTPRAGYRRPAR